jgi:hypothetical protein
VVEVDGTTRLLPPPGVSGVPSGVEVVEVAPVKQQQPEELVVSEESVRPL